MGYSSVRGTSQLLDENLETSTARIISTPHRHLSHINFCHAEAQPAPSTFPPALTAAFEEFGFAIAEEGSEESDGGIGVGTVDGRVSAFPLSFSPILGKFRSSGVQYLNSRSVR